MPWVEPVQMSVRPLGYEGMGGRWRRYFRDLSAYEAPFLEEKLLLDGEFPSSGQYCEAFTEFKKFIGLARLYRKPLAMPSERIDAVWHQFLLFSKDYVRFCDTFHGGYFHHNPDIPSRPLPPGGLDNLVRLYTSTYGEMPEIWDVCDHAKRRILGAPGCTTATVAPTARVKADLAGCLAGSGIAKRQ